MASSPSDLWWKNAVIYSLDVETYLDLDGDGHGDLAGLTERIDYLAGIGVSVLWLMPFYPTPNRDDGYDVTDYYAVDPRLGSLGDFVELVHTAKDRGMRVLVDLVVNHTSDQHPWFRSARSSPSSPFRDFYVWVDEPPHDPDASIVFPDAEDSVWAFDEEADQWYLHNFYSHQPDLNIDNPRVRDEIAKIAGFWLELGVDGFRVDAVPFLIEVDRRQGANTDDEPAHQVVRDLRAFLSRRRGSSVMLGEVNLPTTDLERYFGGPSGDELQLLFDFPLMQATFLALARQRAAPIETALRSRSEQSESSQWAIFLRNHDELTLDQLSEAERQEVFAAFGPDPEMQLFGRGLRRRLPPMLDGDSRRIRLAYSLLFTLPGTPVLFYGEEIGMGENLEIPGRRSVRTPMQWTDEPNGGFSSAPTGALARPVTTGRFGPEEVNVADQRRDPESLLNWFERVIRRRREVGEFGFGTAEVLDSGDERVLAHRCTWRGTAAVAVHNLSPAEVKTTVRLGDVAGFDRVIDLLDRGGTIEPLEGPELMLDLPPYGHRWLRLERRGKRAAP